MAVMDEIVDLGDGMFGILSQPPAGQAKAVCVVLFNAGIMHRSGPFRLHVRLARRLAALGYPTLRFDLPGVGDSLRRADRPQMQIVRDVLDRTQAQTGCTRFVTGGICSAADLGWQLALEDPRIAGVLMLDGLARKGPAFLKGRLLRARRKSSRAWLESLRRHLVKRPAAVDTPENLRDWPAPGVEKQQLRDLLGRGVEFFILFSGGTSYFLHPGQLEETFGPAVHNPAVRFQHWAQCDHMIYANADRDRLVAEVSDWLQTRLPA